MNQMARIVLFDVDNTLLSTGGAGSLAMRRMVAGPRDLRR